MIYKKLIEYIKELLLYNSKQMIIKLISLFIFEYLKIMNEFQYLIYDNLYKTIMRFWDGEYGSPIEENVMWTKTVSLMTNGVNRHFQRLKI